VSGNISEAKVAFGDIRSFNSLQTMGTENGIACNFTLN
jgi:hypothetical protein